MSHECHFVDQEGCEKEAGHSLPMADGNAMWLCDPCYEKGTKIILGWAKGEDTEERRQAVAEYFKKYPNVHRHLKER
jgi:hypothetical protein